MPDALHSSADDDAGQISGYSRVRGPNPDAGSCDLATLRVDDVHPTVVDPMGGSTLVVDGLGFSSCAGSPAIAVSVGGVPVQKLEVLSDTQIRVETAAVGARGAVSIDLSRERYRASRAGLTAWSPADIAGARVFDAASNVTTLGADKRYEWQRINESIGDSWRMRDGNTVNWLPSTNKFWMVGGWNGLREPEGFSDVDPDEVYPLHNTTNEVWSSSDGVSWKLEVPHGHPQFERRHAHNTMLFKDKLWVIGGDYHQGYYNHDVLSSGDGVHWETVYGPGKARPPWSARGMQISGVFKGKLWTGHGQDMEPDPDQFVHHNDLWSSPDGVQWTQVAADGPASATRPAGCATIDGFVEFKGEMWLLGCAQWREDARGHIVNNQVWSTKDGVTWKQHKRPDWLGTIWPRVVVWDDRLWTMFGYSDGTSADGAAPGNSGEVWYSDDGDTWHMLPWGSPVPQSHAQGIAVTDSALVMAGGNYTFAFGKGMPSDKSVWRLLSFHGQQTTAWASRGPSPLTVRATASGTPPLYVADAFGPGRPGILFDGHKNHLELASPDIQASGRSVFWVARAPFAPAPEQWQDDYNPSGTIVSDQDDGSEGTYTMTGYANGQVVQHARAGQSMLPVFRSGAGLQNNAGETRLVGVTHSMSGKLQAWIDGKVQFGSAQSPYATRSWTRIGGGLDYANANDHFTGTMGAVIITPSVLDDVTINLMHEWAIGRFGAK